MDCYTGMPNGWKERRDYSMYARKLEYAKDLGHDMVWKAIAAVGGHRVFNSAFNKVSYKYLGKIN